MAVDQVVGSRVKQHLDAFDKATSRVGTAVALYQPSTSEVIYLLATVAPICALDAVKRCWAATTGTTFPSVTGVARLVSALDELVLCAFFRDLHNGMPGEDPSLIRRDFVPLNSAMPDGGKGCKSLEAATQADEILVK
ncbi:unnamed protein product [Parajaminaea phylloscopi]